MEKNIRILLHHVKGATSYQDLRTVNDIQYETYKEACKARNLLEDDNEYQRTLEEACSFGMPSALRLLFVSILLNCSPINSVELLWENFKEQLSEDIRYQYLQTHNDINNDYIYNQALIDIESKLSH